MAYVTVSTWRYEDGQDEAALEASARDNLSQLKAMGAVGGYLVRTSENEGMVVVIYPDEGTWNRVRDMVTHMRANTDPAVGGRNISVLSGAAVVAV
ncbi:hypothetical protein [Ruegeria hyattellae]|uniref:hypothetical protein n=1 Tax=Ruegeria hyattellae TaxID=3233337 RepID=UPI00355B62DF